MRKKNVELRAQSSELRGSIFLCSVLAACLCVMTGCAPKEIKNTGSKGTNIICFGDSITFGYGAGPEEDYPTALGKLVSVPVINAGIDGDTTDEALKRLQADVLDRDPYLVVIEFCGNDFLRKIPAQKTLANIEEMIDRAQARGAIVALADISAGMFLREYRGYFSALAREKKAIFIPAILNGIITNPSLKSDFLHPNKEGYTMIAERVYHAIKPYLHNS